MTDLLLDKRLFWVGFAISLVASILANPTGLLPGSLVLVVTGAVLVGLSAARPFPETEGPDAHLGGNRSLARGNGAVFMFAFALLGLAAGAAVIVPPIALAGGYSLSLWRLSLLAWPWVLLASVAWVGRPIREASRPTNV